MHLLLCSLASGLTLTFQELARATRFEFTDLEIEVQGKNRAGTNGLGEVFIRAKLTVDSKKDRAAALALLRKAHAVNVVSKTIAIPQMLESIVEAAREPAENWSNQDALVKLQV